MVTIPSTPRLPKLLSATTLALMLALVFMLFVANERKPGRFGAPLYLAWPHKSADSVAGWRTRKPTSARLVLERQLDSLGDALDSLARALPGDGGSKRDALRAFRLARLAYKQSEALLALYSPTTAHALNGPLENDDGDAPPRPLGSSAGFQVVLTSIDGAFGDERETSAAAASATGATRSVGRSRARAAAISMRDQVRHLRTQTRYLDVGELPVLEGARAEIARITTLGLAGFDLDDPRDAVREAAASFEGMREIAEAEAEAGSSAGPGVSREEWHRVSRALLAAHRYLLSHPDFERLDRLAFITRFANHSAQAVAAARAPLLAHAYPQRRVWRASAATVFEPHALDPAAFAPDFAPAATPELIALGRSLFSDSRLAGAQDRSCATCHQPARAFADGRARPLLIGDNHSLARNTPTLLDVAYQPLYFADERALSLEDQIGIVLASHAEMGSSADLAATHLARDSTIRQLFARALAGAGARDSNLTGRNVRIALAAYLRSLDSFDSRFDRATRGDTLALTTRERLGYTLFMGRARCGTCHFAPLFSGVMPPEFTSSEPEIIGALARTTMRHPRLDPDSGRAGIDHLAEHLYAFKVPTLRNVELTAPYMHNGAYATLDDVMDFYEHGGGAGLGAHLPNPTLASTRLHLTVAERSAIIAFLRTLTDTSSQNASRANQLQHKTIAAR
jgi:cytochrome c peroxidase